MEDGHYHHHSFTQILFLLLPPLPPSILLAYPREEFNLAIAATARLAGSMAKYLGLPLPFRMGHGIGDPWIEPSTLSLTMKRYLSPFLLVLFSTLPPSAIKWHDSLFPLSSTIPFDRCPLRLEGKESNPFLHGLTMLCINVASLAHWMGLEEIREDMALRPLSILSLGIHHYLT